MLSVCQEQGGKGRFYRTESVKRCEKSYSVLSTVSFFFSSYLELTVPKTFMAYIHYTVKYFH